LGRLCKRAASFLCEPPLSNRDMSMSAQLELIAVSAGIMVTSILAIGVVVFG